MNLPRKFPVSAAAWACAGLLLALQAVRANGPDPVSQGSPVGAIFKGDSARAQAADTVSALDTQDSLSAGMEGSASAQMADDSVRAADSSSDRMTENDSTQAMEADSARSAQVDSAQGRPPPIPIDEMRVIDNRAFGVGERLEFEISYGPIKAGSAVMEVREVVQVDGRDCYRVISTARSSRFFSAIYRVEDRVESFIDVRGLFPWKFQQKLEEGKHRANRWALYDQVHHTVTTNRGELDTPPYVQDVLSIMYYARTREMAVGDTLYVDSHSGRKVYPLAVKILGREHVEVPAGTFDCLVVEPMLKAGGLFKHEGRIWVWLTDDAVKVPVLMKTKVIIGTVDAKLKTYRLGKNL